MYDKVGKQMKTAASIISVIGMILSCVYGLFMLQASGFVGIVTIFIGCLFSWMAMIPLYAIGAIVESAQESQETLNEILTLMRDRRENPESIDAAQNDE